MWVGGGGIPSDYLVSTQLQLLLFCCNGNGNGLLIVINHTLIIIHNLDFIVEFKLTPPYFFEGFADAHSNLVFFANMELLNLCMKMF